MSINTSFTFRAPGRVCLFGDHQDYLGLPVIACAIDRWIYLKARPNQNRNIHIQFEDLGTERILHLDGHHDSLESDDHMVSALRVVERYGCFPNHGFDIRIHGTIPINAGLSSSSALVVVWVHFLLKTFGCDRDITPEFIAQIAYEAEVLEHQGPGGNMDQFSISLGDVQYIQTRPPFHCKNLGKNLGNLVIAESGVPKFTLEVLANLKTKVLTGLNEIKVHMPAFDLSKATLETLDEVLPYVSENLKVYVSAAIKNHEITWAALREFQQKPPEAEILASLMNAHHTILRNDLGITVPLIDQLIETGLEKGAMGAKIVGSGGGGSMVFMASPGMERTLIKHLMASGAKDAYKVEVVSGTEMIVDD